MPSKTKLSPKEEAERKYFYAKKKETEGEPFSPQAQFYQDAKNFQFYLKSQPIDNWEAFSIEPNFNRIRMGLSKVTCKPYAK